MKALTAHGMTRDDLPYKAPFQPWGSWFALVATGIITLFKGFDTFIPFKVDTFITYVKTMHALIPCSSVSIFRSYIGVPIFFILWLGYKIMYRTREIPSKEVDLVTGMRQIDEEEERFLKHQASFGPQSTLGKLWDSL